MSGGKGWRNISERLLHQAAQDPRSDFGKWVAALDSEDLKIIALGIFNKLDANDQQLVVDHMAGAAAIVQLWWGHEDALAYHSESTLRHRAIWRNNVREDARKEYDTGLRTKNTPYPKHWSAFETVPDEEDFIERPCASSSAAKDDSDGPFGWLDEKFRVNLKLGGLFRLGCDRRLEFTRNSKRKECGIPNNLFSLEDTTFVYLLTQREGQGEEILLKIGCSEGNMKSLNAAYRRLPADPAGDVSSRTGPALYMKKLMGEGKSCRFHVYALPRKGAQVAARPVEKAFIAAYRRANGGSAPPLNVIENGTTWAKVRRALGF
jgi:hypothetical protein